MTNHLRAGCALAVLAWGVAPLSAQCDLTTLFASNNGGMPGGAVYFDMTVTQAIRVTGLDVNTSINGFRVGLTMFTAQGGTSGNIGNPAAWTQVAIDDGQALGQGLDNPTPIDFLTPVVIVPGSYGVALIGDGTGGPLKHEYTNGNGSNENYSNPLFSISLGSASNTPFDTTNLFSPRVWNGTIKCSGANGTFANFTVTPSTGPSPLNVNFRDTSSSTNTITAWAWDLDGDSVVDSNAQNPPFIYGSCGRYDVTLTVTDNTSATDTITKEGLIVVDPNLLVQASYTSAPGGTLQVQFSDRSSGLPTNWSWDFDGDNVPDSTLQNPLYTYPVGGFYDVTLTASNSCGSDSITEEIFVLGNDDCGLALGLNVGLNGPYSNVGATSNQSWSCASGASEVWFRFTPTCNGAFEFNTCTGSDYDTAMTLYDGSCSRLNELACNDDFCGLQSGISATLVGGTTYYLAVGGFSGAQGEFKVDVVPIGGAGAFTTAFPACGAISLVASGSPNIGGFASYDLSGHNGVPYIFFGWTFLGVPVCAPGSCVLGSSIDAVFQGITVSGAIPCDPTLIGGQVYTQGFDFGAAGGCNFSGVNIELSESILTTIG